MRLRIGRAGRVFSKNLRRRNKHGSRSAMFPSSEYGRRRRLRKCKKKREQKEKKTRRPSKLTSSRAVEASPHPHHSQIHHPATAELSPSQLSASHSLPSSHIPNSASGRRRLDSTILQRPLERDWKGGRDPRLLRRRRSEVRRDLDERNRELDWKGRCLRRRIPGRGGKRGKNAQFELSPSFSCPCKTTHMIRICKAPLLPMPSQTSTVLVIVLNASSRRPLAVVVERSDSNSV